MPQRIPVDQEKPIDYTVRNGMITAAGIFLGFLLNFLAYWTFAWAFLGAEKRSGEPLAWRSVDFFVAGLLLLGITVITVALCAMIVPYEQTVKSYCRKVWVFVAGTILALLGVFLSVLATVPGF